MLGTGFTPDHQVGEAVLLFPPPVLKLQHDLLVLRLVVVPEPKVDDKDVPWLRYAVQAWHQLLHEVLGQIRPHMANASVLREHGTPAQTEPIQPISYSSSPKAGMSPSEYPNKHDVKSPDPKASQCILPAPRASADMMLPPGRWGQGETRHECSHS